MGFSVNYTRTNGRQIARSFVVIGTTSFWTSMRIKLLRNNHPSSAVGQPYILSFVVQFIKRPWSKVLFFAIDEERGVWSTDKL